MAIDNINGWSYGRCYLEWCVYESIEFHLVKIGSMDCDTTIRVELGKMGLHDNCKQSPIQRLPSVARGYSQ